MNAATALPVIVMLIVQTQTAPFLANVTKIILEMVSITAQVEQLLSDSFSRENSLELIELSRRNIASLVLV